MTAEKISFSFHAVVSHIHGDDQLEQLVGPFLARLEELGGTRLAPTSQDTKLPILWLIATGGTERHLLQLWENQRGRHPSSSPVILVAHKWHNSLAAALEILAALRQRGEAGRGIFFNDPDDSSASERLVQSVQELTADVHLRSTRLGLLGAPSEWLVASSPTVEQINSLWGTEVVEIPVSRLITTMRDADPKAVEVEAAELLNNAKEVLEPVRGDLQGAARVYLALRELARQEKLQALSLRCFDLVSQKRLTACYALARLNEEGIIAGCEGDLVSTLGMLWAQSLLGLTPWMANVTRANELDGTLGLAHCTVPRSLVREYVLRSHFESGVGVGLQGSFPTGPVTLLRLGGKKLDALWLAEGQITGANRDERLCRTQVELKIAREAVAELLQRPLGNHLIMVAGHWAARLRSHWDLVNDRRAGDGAGDGGHR